MRALETREAGGADRATVIGLWERCGLTRPWNDPVADFEQAVNGPTSTVLVGTDPATGAVVGTVMAGYDGHRGWVYYLAAEPERRHEGIGRRMMVAAEDWLREAGAVKVQLMVRSANEQVTAFYGRIGYERQDVAVLGRWLNRPST